MSVLYEEWAIQYPQIFDEVTLSHARGQAHLGKHFVEWLAAILVHQATGYACLPSYFEPSSRRQYALMHQVLDEAARGIVLDRSFHCQPLDLLFYAPDFSNWFFCEVKGPGDRIRAAQQNYYSKIAEITGKPIYVLTLKKM